MIRNTVSLLEQVVCTRPSVRAQINLQILKGQRNRVVRTSRKILVACLLIQLSYGPEAYRLEIKKTPFYVQRVKAGA